MGSYILLGSPGAGKGLLGQHMKEQYEMEYFSSGDILRSEVANETEIGIEIKTTMAEGGQVNDELITQIVLKKLEALILSSKKFIIDGFPQTLIQLESLQQFLALYPAFPVAFVCVEVDRETAFKRMTGRISCLNCQKVYHRQNDPPLYDDQCDSCDGALVARESDQNEKAAKRLDLFENSTKKIMELIKGRSDTLCIDANGTIRDSREKFLKVHNAIQHHKK
ncbi:MAG: nucleoside monophosphate kinase [Verrucomicrobia bacterium]|nr:nucleoside monophosphate kinase [Verrucomicrobiota bacterium]